MLFVLQEEANVFGLRILQPQCTLSVPSVALPKAHIALSTLQKYGSFPMALPPDPLPFVQIAVVIKAATHTMTQILSPLARVFII